MAHDVFICYSNQDKSTADSVASNLESKGVRCWIAPRDIMPGIPWGEAIIDAITTSQVMVLILSSHANESHQVLREVERAASKRLVILPFRIENIPLSKSMEFFISASHWLDASTHPIEQHLIKLSSTIESLLAEKRKPRDLTDAAKNKNSQFTQVKILAEHSPSVSSIAVSRNGKLCATGGADGIAKLWDTDTWVQFGEIQRNDRVHSLTFDPENRQLLILQTNSHEVELWGIERQTLGFSFDNGSTANCAAFSPDGSTLAIGSRDHTTKLWDRNLEYLTGTLKHPYRVQSLAYSFDGQFLAVAGGYEEVRLWNLRTRDPVLVETDTNSSNAFKVMFTPDDSSLLTLRAEMRLAEICDIRTGKLNSMFRFPSKLQSAAFSAAGDLLAAGAWDSRIYIWDVSTGKVVNTLEGHRNIVTSVAFSSDDQYLITGSWDSTLRLWLRKS